MSLVLCHNRTFQNASYNSETKFSHWAFLNGCRWFVILWHVYVEPKTVAMPRNQDLQCAVRLWVCSHLQNWTTHMCKIFSNSELSHFMWRVFRLWCLLSSHCVADFQHIFWFVSAHNLQKWRWGTTKIIPIQLINLSIDLFRHYRTGELFPWRDISVILVLGGFNAVHIFFQHLGNKIQSLSITSLSIIIIESDKTTSIYNVSTRVPSKK